MDTEGASSFVWVDWQREPPMKNNSTQKHCIIFFWHLCCQRYMSVLCLTYKFFPSKFIFILVLFLIFLSSLFLLLLFLIIFLLFSSSFGRQSYFVALAGLVLTICSYIWKSSSLDLLSTEITHHHARSMSLFFKGFLNCIASGLRNHYLLQGEACLFFPAARLAYP